MHAYFSRDNVALPGIAGHFKAEAHEEWGHAEKVGGPWAGGRAGGSFPGGPGRVLWWALDVWAACRVEERGLSEMGGGLVGGRVGGWVGHAVFVCWSWAMCV